MDVRARRPYDSAKRCLDCALAGGALAAFSPLWLAIAAAIKLTSPGPVFFARTVVGRQGRPFVYYKFRTMRHRNDDSQHLAFLERNIKEDKPFTVERDPATGEERPVYKVVCDPRVTTVGRLLRRTSLDEIPQLLNVLRGEMSVVGPRPPIEFEYQFYDDETKRRLSVLPGLTGLAQVRGRGRVSFRDMVALDLDYVRRRSLLIRPENTSRHDRRPKQRRVRKTQPMKVLVTGGAGFIGSHTVDLLLARGHDVRILDALRPPVHPKGEKPAYLPPEAEFIKGDVRDREDMLTALRGVDAVIHLAAYQDYLTDFSTFFHINTVGTSLLYELIVAHNLPVRKVVVASSQATYGEAKYRCPNPSCPLTTGRRGADAERYPELRPEKQLRALRWEPLCPGCDAVLEPIWTDEARVAPHNQYAMSKYTQEMVALNLGRRYSIPSVCMRYSIVQGRRQSFTNAYSGVLRIFATRMLAGKEPMAYEDGGQLRDYVYVGDVAAANLLALQDPRADYRCFNVGGGHATTVLEFGEMVARAVGCAIRPRVPGQHRFGDTRHVFSDTQALRALGWRTTKTPQEVVDEYVAWAANHPDLTDSYGEAEKVMLRTGAVRQAARQLVAAR